MEEDLERNSSRFFFESLSLLIKLYPNPLSFRGVYRSLLRGGLVFLLYKWKLVNMLFSIGSKNWLRYENHSLRGFGKISFLSFKKPHLLFLINVWYYLPLVFFLHPLKFGFRDYASINISFFPSPSISQTFIQEIFLL